MEIFTMMAGNSLLYIDPAATSILLTSISGILIAVGATAVILWRKFKKKAAKVLKIDENANKEVEEDLVINDEELNLTENNEDISKEDNREDK